MTALNFGYVSFPRRKRRSQDAASRYKTYFTDFELSDYPPALLTAAELQALSAKHHERHPELEEQEPAQQLGPEGEWDPAEAPIIWHKVVSLDEYRSRAC